MIYDRELIARMLDGMAAFGAHGNGFEPRAVREQARLLREADGAGVRTAAQPPSGGEVVAPTLPVEVHGAMYDVPIRVQLHIEHLRTKLDAIGGTKGSHPVLTLLDAVDHCLSAADEGVDYGLGRPMLDAMTTLGLMEKVGRGKWAPTEAAQRFATLARTTPPSAPVGVEAIRRMAEVMPPKPMPGDDYGYQMSPSHLRALHERFAALAQQPAAVDDRIEAALKLLHPHLDTGDSRSAPGWAIEIYAALAGVTLAAQPGPTA